MYGSSGQGDFLGRVGMKHVGKGVYMKVRYFPFMLILIFHIGVVHKI